MKRMRQKIDFDELNTYAIEMILFHNGSTINRWQ